MESKGSEPQFEFDERKSRLNSLKHGIDFVEAQALWLDEALLEGRGRGTGETRLLMIGRIEAETLGGGHHLPGTVHPDHLGAESTREGDRGI